jgi:NTP pyrophosphatase (non-canonical NTP hydrolase)
MTTNGLSFAELRHVSLQRCVRWHPGGIGEWSLSDWFTATMGELGEAANVAKKLNRIRDGMVGNGDATEEKLRADLADEIADVAIYLDILAASEGIDLGAAIARKFNATSEKVGFPERLPMFQRTVTDGEQSMASLADMQAWASAVMLREPDFIIGDNYLRRWWVVPRNQWCNVYLHEILRSDDDRALHDHPWANSSFVIEGGYIEHLPAGDRRNCKPGSIVHREAEQRHRLEITDGGRAVSLFITGPKIREWGFDCPQGWRHWKEFVNAENPGLPGKGCGED